MPNIDAISGALIILSLLVLNSQCEEGARDGIDIGYMEINIFMAEIFMTHHYIIFHHMSNSFHDKNNGADEILAYFLPLFCP